MQSAVTAYVALGANIGNRQANIERAIANLDATEGIQVVQVSSLVENPAVGGPEDSPAFVNGVVEIQTTLRPRELLERMLQIEQELGRVRREKWGPRVIELDLILYGDQVVVEEGLQVPHPLMHERKFVLEPLAEIAPEAQHPIMGLSMAELLKLLGE